MILANRLKIFVKEFIFGKGAVERLKTYNELTITDDLLMIFKDFA